MEEVAVAEGGNKSSVNCLQSSVKQEQETENAEKQVII